MTEAWTGLVLAGGRSSRMGRDKALLPWRGRTLLEHMQQLLRDAGAQRVVVSGPRPHCDAVVDRVPDLGPLGGLHAAVEALADTCLLVVPVDMPMLDAALLRRLVDAPACACASFAAQPLPMRVRVDAACRAALQELLAHASPQQRSLRALQRALGGATLALSAGETALLAECNTPEQWQALVA